MWPTLRFLTDDLLKKIVAEAREVFSRLGVTIYNERVLRLLGDHGATIDLEKSHALFTPSKAFKLAFSRHDVKRSDVV